MKKAVVSCYILVWHSVVGSLAPGVKSLPMPSRLRSMYGATLAVRDLGPVAKRRMTFLHEDLQKVKRKHLEATAGRVCC